MYCVRVASSGIIVIQNSVKIRQHTRKLKSGGHRPPPQWKESGLIMKKIQRFLESKFLASHCVKFLYTLISFPGSSCG
jgi:hypothetical protein